MSVVRKVFDQMEELDRFVEDNYTRKFKMSKMNLIATSIFFDDMCRNSRSKFTSSDYEKLAEYNYQGAPKSDARQSYGASIREHYRK
jgi:hypothetical protein